MKRFFPVATAILFLVVVIGCFWFFIFSDAPDPLDAVNQKSDLPEVLTPAEHTTPPDPITPIANTIASPIDFDVDYQISGQVRDLIGINLDAVEVLLYEQGESKQHVNLATAPLHKAHLDGDWGFSFDTLNAGDYCVVARAEDAAGITQVSLTQNEPSANIQIVLQNCNEISGRVVDSVGSPVPGAVVVPIQSRWPTEYISDSTGYTGLGVLSFTTDHEGRFSVLYIREYYAILCVTAGGFPRHYTQRYEKGTEGIEIVLGQTSKVRGVLLEKETRKPLSEVELTIRGALTQDHQRIVTDDKGEFFVTTLGAGKYKLTMNASPYILLPETDVFEIVRGQDTEVTILAVRSGSISGRIFDVDTDKGLGGADIGIGRSPQTLKMESKSRSDGTFIFEGIAPGIYEIFPMATVKDYLPTRSYYEGINTSPIQLSAGENFTGINIPMKRGIEVSGVVLDKNRIPIEGASVYGMDGNGGMGGQTTSGREGTFRVVFEKPTSVARVFAQISGMIRTRTERLNVPAEGLEGVEIVFGAGSTVSGVVVNQQGVPVKGTAVSLIGDSSYTSYPSGTQGQFKVTNVELGTYRISTRNESITSSPIIENGQTVTVHEGEDLTELKVVVSVPVGLKLSGMVCDTTGEPIVGATIGIDTMDGEWHTSSDTEGRFSLSGLPEGSCQVNVSHPDYSPANVPGIAVGSTNVIIEMQGFGRIEGTVLDAETRRPIELFQIAAIQRSDFYNFGKGFITVANEKGHFTLQNLALGNIEIIVQAEGYEVGQTVIKDITENKTVHGVQILLTPGGTLHGLVTDTQGNPIAGASIVQGNAPSKNESIHVLASTNAEGSFSLSPLPAGLITLTAIHRSYLPTTISIDSTETPEVALILGQGGVIEGRVLSGGRPVPNLHIQYEKIRNTGNAESTDANGYYRFVHVPTGIAKVMVSLPDSPGAQRREKFRNAEVQEGMTTVVDFALDATTASLQGTLTQDGEPVVDTQLELVVSNAGGDESFSARTDSEGNYAFESLPSGQGKLLVNHSSIGMRVFSVTLLEGESTQGDFELSRGAKIVCRIALVTEEYDEYVFLFSGDSPTIPESLEAAEAWFTESVAAGKIIEGQAEITGIAPGNYTVVGISMPTEGFDKEEEMFKRVRFVNVPVNIEDTETVEVSLEF